MSKPAILALADGSIFRGESIGADGSSVGEVVFNTAMTGYQEILTDPSYARQIVTLTYPHIGNTGVTPEDVESDAVQAAGLVIRDLPLLASNWRCKQTLDDYLRENGIVAIAGIDTRRLTRHLRDNGAQAGVVVHGEGDVAELQARAAAWPGLVGADLAKQVSCTQSYQWDQTRWTLDHGHGTLKDARRHVVAVDYGAKQNILRCLASAGCRVTVVPAATGFEDILRLKPDGVFLSNGPGDPQATGVYAIPAIQGVMDAGVPLFGICLGHQLLALALVARTTKMHFGHRGANHPVKDLSTAKVEITSQNHGFVVDADSLPAGVRATHVSLFDQTLEGLRVEGRPVFSVQYHPEASPGPQDSHYVFERFMGMMEG